RRRLGNANAKADRLLVAAAKRRLHALANRYRIAQFLRHAIGVGGIERTVEDDLGEKARGGRCGGRSGIEQVTLHGNRCHAPLLPSSVESPIHNSILPGPFPPPKASR